MRSNTARKEEGRLSFPRPKPPTHAVVRVRDFGVGIKPEDLNKVLDPAMYFTTYGTGKRGGVGTGGCSFAWTWCIATAAR